MRDVLLVSVLLGLLLLGGSAAGAQVYEQTIVLQPGWNAVHLQVQPEDNRPTAVFQGVPVASVWTYNPRPPGLEFIQDPAEGLFNVEGWLGFFPEPRPEAILTNLYIVEVNRTYLIKLEGTQPFTWRLQGRPSLQRFTWQPNSYNLVGFPVDPSTPPSFGDFFAPSEAHAGQPIYKLAPNGAWQLVAQPFSEPIVPGRAYWVYTEGGSSYQGLLDVGVEFEDGLLFSATLDRQRLRYFNRGALPSTVSFRELNSSNPVNLVIRQFDADTGQVSWPELPPVYVQDVDSEGEGFVTLGVRRAEFATDLVESILEVRDSQGMRYLLPVSGQTLSSQQIEEAEQIASGGAGLRSTDLEQQLVVRQSRQLLLRTQRNTAISNYAGLWVGTVSVDAVSESQLAGTIPTSVGRPFEFRVLVHVDGSGQARLLKEVIQMFQEGTLIPDPNDPTRDIVDRPARYVLLTDDSLIPQFTGVQLRDGVPVGLRQSTVAYDFEQQFLNMQGTFDLGGSLTVSMSLGSDFPTNPFKHRYHPDHDNLDAQFLNPRAEALSVNRTMTFQLANSDANGANRPTFGSNLMVGVYRETLSGLHKNNIFVEGTFTLERAASTPVLNQ